MHFLAIPLAVPFFFRQVIIVNGVRKMNGVNKVNPVSAGVAGA